MKTHSWQTIRDELRARHQTPPLPPPELFWAQGRQRLAQRRAPGSPVETAPVLLFWATYRRWAATAAAAIVLIAGIAILEWRGADHQGSVFSRVSLSALERVDVWVDYQNILVVNSARHRGTVVWVNGINEQNDPN